MTVTLLLASACGDPTTVSDGTLTVERHVATLELHNSSSAAAYYFVADRNTLALLDWIPCVSATCPRVPARQSKSLPHASIYGYSSSTSEVVVYWWRAVSDGQGGQRPDSVRAIVTAL